MTTTIGSAVADAARRLEAAHIERPQHEARLLMAATLGLDFPIIVGRPERVLGADEAAFYAAGVGRRAGREPLSRIVGRREFWGMPFRVTPETFDPRPDSEAVVEAVLGRIGNRESRLRALDLGTGTGCLLLALLSELPGSSGVGIDLSAAALEMARANARDLGLADRSAFDLGDWGSKLAEGFDIVVGNPPYVRSDEVAALAPEVTGHEPILALDGGPDGLAAYRSLAGDLARLLHPGGVAVLEIGAGQAAAVRGIIGSAGLRHIGSRRDLRGIVRCLAFEAAR